MALLGSAGEVAAEVAIPELQARASDLTGTLTPGDLATLEEKLAGLESRTGSQIAVLVIPATDDEPIEQYALRVVEDWKLGRQGVDDGALLLVALEDRKVRIEVGYGLEGALSDIVSRRIISESILPRFRSGDIAGGIEAGLDRMIGVIEGEPLPEPQTNWNPGPLSRLKGLLPILLIVAFAGGGLLRAVLGRFWGSLAAGTLIGVLVWLLIGIAFLSVLAGVIVFFALLLAGIPGGGGRWSSRPRTGGWVGGGWSGGGFSGGGFSGGGGSFGGGGASGSW